jgi:EAL domain-containing protein (putative c-di-GMP-specific phosphodiesterase class I)
MNIDDRTIQFYKLYEQLASATANINKAPDVKLIESLLNQIAALFRLSKGITRFYRNPAEEKSGGGETMISYDTGVEGVPVHSVRFVTRLMSISTMTVYMSPEETPLSEEELRYVDLTMRTALAYVSRNRLQDIAESLAFFDDSGYRNTRSFYYYIEWKNHPGGFDNKVALNYNLRHFSLVNEEIGRENGDRVMKNHYNQVEKLIGNNGIVARLGGDNFVCICDSCDFPELLSFLSEGLVSYDDSGDILKIRTSIGVFVIPDNFTTTTPIDIMGRIIAAERIAQSGKHGHLIYYDGNLSAQKDKSMRIQQRFQEAITNEEFHVYYQPKVNTANGEISGAEALCRWIRDGEVISPADFIPVLEETNDICKLDFYMLDKVCQDIRKWLDQGRRVVRVSVNLSRKHIMDSRLLDNIIGIIDRNNVPHEYIEIELTETNTDVGFRDLKLVVSGLQSAHIYTSVDDFGMGYSSLNLLRVIPWNVLKVDRSFLPLDDEDADSIRSIMFKHVVTMAKELGLECIVEGVETPAQLCTLRENNCDLAQGYLFDKPLPVDEFVTRLDKRLYEL